MKNEVTMSVHLRRKNNRCFAQYGKIGKYYYYACENKEAEKKAIEKANKQGPSIERFVRNYWSTKEDF